MASGTIKNSSPQRNTLGLIPKSVDNLNNLPIGYMMAWDYSSKPENAPFDAGDCYHFGGYYRHQLSFSYNSGVFKTRTYYNGSWSSWT